MTISFLIYLSGGLFLGWSLGANDAANIFGTAVGTRMLKFSTAALIASIFVVIGAVYGGEGTTHTLNQLGSINTMAGAFMSVVSAAITIYWMTKSKIAVSTSQAIVGAIIGWNIYSDKATDFSILSNIASTWIICPILSGIIAVIVYYLSQKIINKTSPSLFKQDYYLRIGLILSGAFASYALGANNIANIVGVFVGSNQLQAIDFSFISFSPNQLLFLLGGTSIAVGIITYSKKIMMTLGNEIMTMSPLIALVVVFSQSLVLFIFASSDLHNFLLKHNLPAIPLVPVSSSQAVVGAVMGIGLIKNARAVNWRIIYKFIIGWITTPIIAGTICFVSLFILANVFKLTVYR